MKACKRSIVLMKFRDHLAKNLSESGINCLDIQTPCFNTTMVQLKSRYTFTNFLLSTAASKYACSAFPSLPMQFDT